MGLLNLVSGACSMAQGEWVSLDTVGNRFGAIKAAGAAFVMFSIGAFLPLVSFFIFDGLPAIVVSGVICASFLFDAGIINAKRNRVQSGFKYLIGGLVSATIAYVAGCFSSQFLN